MDVRTMRSLVECRVELWVGSLHEQVIHAAV